MTRYDAGLLSIEQAAGMFLTPNTKVKSESDNSISFQDVLASKAEENVKFSKHASERLESRNISLSNTQMNRLNEGVNRARGKNINESLVMMDNLAFIVNVKNNTVVTALESADDSVFTNIDGAVIV